MITPYRLYEVLLGRSHPGLAGLCRDGDDCVFCLNGAPWRYDGVQWTVGDHTVPAVWDAFGSPGDHINNRVYAEIERVLATVESAALLPEDVAPKPALNGTLVYRLLGARPYPVASDLRLNVQGVCRFTLDGAEWSFDDQWYIGVESFIHHLPAAEHVTADLLHAEIGRVRVLVDSPSWEQTKERCVGPDLPGAEQTANDPLYDRATAAQALAKVTAERDHLLIAESTLSKIAAALAIPALEPHDDALSMVRRLVDGYTVVSQRLVGSQKEVAEVTERATKAEARVKRLLRQRNAAHNVLDEAGFAMPQEGKRRRPLAVRVSLAHAQVWDSYDCINAIDEIAKAIGLISPCRSDGVTEGEVVARVKALHQEDELRAAIAVAVGLDGSASLALILDTVTRERPDDPRAVKDLRALVNYHQAPIRFNARPLTLAERAAFVIRRLWQGRTNAANESAALRRELSDISDALGDLPDTAEREPIGDREEHLGLSTAERIRFTLTNGVIRD